MHNIDSKRVLILIAVCGFLAVFITVGWNSLKQPSRNSAYTGAGKPITAVTDNPTHVVVDKSVQEAADADRRIAEARAAQHAAFLARYLNSGFTRKPGIKMIAVANSTEDGRYNTALDSIITDRFKTDSVIILNSLFRPAFVADGLFANVLTGSSNVLEQLELSETLDVLLLGRQTVQYSSDSSLENVITANMRFELTAISTANNQKKSWAYIANGAGFKQTEARLMAEERLIKQIAKDTTLSLKF